MVAAASVPEKWLACGASGAQAKNGRAMDGLERHRLGDHRAGGRVPRAQLAVRDRPCRPGLAGCRRRYHSHPASVPLPRAASQGTIQPPAG
jgi:hypothetical protein